MSQIIATNMQIHLKEDDVDQILTLVNQLPKGQRQYLLLIFLSYAYEMPHQAVSYLKNKNMYRSFLEEVTKVEF